MHVCGLHANEEERDQHVKALKLCLHDVIHHYHVHRFILPDIFKSNALLHFLNLFLKSVLWVHFLN